MLPLVSIIVLNYNGKKFLKDCFDTLLNCTYPKLELIMVDNSSTDDSVALISENYKQVKIIQTGSNSGYSKAYNISFKQAKGKYFILLNNDVKVEPDWIEPLVEAAEKDEKTGALQPKIVSMIDKGYFEYAGSSGGFMDKYGFPFLRGRVVNTIEKDYGQYDDEAEVFWTSGAAMFVRAEALNKSGALDEDFVHHMEEIDLCWRLHLAGYKLKVVPSSKIHHYAGATIKQDSFMKMYWNHRNSVFMLIKNLEWHNLIRVLFVRSIIDVLAVLFSLMIMNLVHMSAIIVAYGWLILNIRLVLKKRKETQKMRSVPDKHILPKLYPKSLVFQYFLKKKRTYQDLKLSRKK